MDFPEHDRDKISSFVKFRSNEGEIIKLGAEDTQLFFEVNGQRKYLTDSSGTPYYYNPDLEYDPENDYTGYAFRITNYNCIGDAVTDNTTAFNALITLIGSASATIEIPTGRFLIGTTTIPRNIELIFTNGGRIIWKSNSTVTISALISAGHKWIFENQSEVVGELPTVKIHQQEWVSAIWWGGKSDGQPGSALTNYYAFRSAWNSVRRDGQLYDGASLKFPSGTYITNGIVAGEDGWNGDCKFADISGAGSAKTTLYLASGQNKSLLKAFGMFETKFSDIGFNGNAAGNTTMTQPLLEFSFYCIKLIDIRIDSCKADGVWYTPGQANVFVVTNPRMINIQGTAIKIINGLNVEINGVIDIESCGVGIEITGTATSQYDSRYSARANIRGTWYGEALPYGLIIRGQCAVRAEFSAYMRSTNYIVHIAYDSDRLLHSMFNYIDVRGSYDSKAMGVILIDDLCPYNQIMVDEHVFVIDNDGSNCINESFYNQKKVFTNKQASILNGTTNFPDISTTGSLTKIAGSPFNDAIAHNVTFGGPASCINNTGQDVYFSCATDGTMNLHYINIVIKGSPSSENINLFLDSTGGLRMVWPEKIFSPSWGTVGKLNNYPFRFNGEWQVYSIPFYPISAGAGFRMFLYSSAWGGTYQIAYVGVTSSSDAALIHKKSNVVIGYNYDSAFMDSASLPPATEVSVGTKVFTLDLGMEVISDGTNWKKPDGTTLGA